MACATIARPDSGTSTVTNPHPDLRAAAPDMIAAPVIPREPQIANTRPRVALVAVVLKTGNDPSISSSSTKNAPSVALVIVSGYGTPSRATKISPVYVFDAP